jgi:germination protein M
MSGSPDKRRQSAGTVVVAMFLLVGLALAAGACGVGGGVGDGGPVSSGAQTTVGEPVEPSGDATTTTETAGSDGSGVTTATSAGPTTTTAAESPPPTAANGTAGTMTVDAYFIGGEKIAAASRTIAKTQGAGAAAMRLLLEGPSGMETEGGMTTAIPEGTTLLGLDIKNGIATVDLSKEYGSGGGSLSMMMRLAQVVFTLTQFPTVQGVNFALDGKPISVLGGEGIIIDHPMTRADYEDLSPAILVESPTLGATVSSPIRITGTANVFEAVFRLNIVDDNGLIIADERVQATSGTGTRGTFDVTVTYPSGPAGDGSLIVFEDSAKDGSPINVVEIPLVLK